MMTNDIQELLDGSLPDEQTAELLHLLSVSPERRAAFRQFMALRGGMRRDKEALALTPEEDARAWKGIAAGIGVALPAASRGVNTVAMAGRLAVVALAGLLGYGIGVSTLTAPVDDAPLAETRSTQVVLSSGSERVSTLLAASLPLPAIGAPDTVRMQVDRIVFRDRWRERIRLVEPMPPVSVASLKPAVASSSTHNATSPTTAVMNKLDGTIEGSGRHESIAHAKMPATTPSGTTDASRDALLLTKSSADSTSLLAHDAPESRRSLEPDELPVPALQRGGLEVGYNERVGRLAAIPRGDARSATYASRYVDLSYRFDRGSYGLGLRFGQGTFSSVTLVGNQMVRRDGAVSRIDTIYRPSIGETIETTVEFFANYRFPLTNRLALGAEMAYNRSTSHEKLGGDLLALLFLTDRIGLQIGGGLSHYWYDLSGERQRLMERGENVGISDDALDSYSGNVFEGRYGLFYTF